MADLKGLQERFEALEGNITRLAAGKESLPGVDLIAIAKAVTVGVWIIYVRENSILGLRPVDRKNRYEKAGFFYLVG